MTGRSKGLVLALVGALTAASALAESTRTLRVVLSGDASAAFAVENLAGTMTVAGGDGDRVEAVATVHAEDEALAALVTFEQVSRHGGRPTLLVRYPVDEHRTFRFPAGKGNSTIEYDGCKVKVSSSHGAMVYVDVEVRLPRHVTDAAFYNHVGALRAEDLEGTIRLDGGSTDITAKHLGGQLRADTGSGDVRADSLSGSFTCDTGSGDCIVTGFDGDALVCDTGSGDVSVRDSKAGRLKADTGSGDIRAESVDLEEFRGDTGSGGIHLQQTGGRLQRVVADTGSGDVSVQLPADASFELSADVGSGDIVSHFADAQPIIHHRRVVGFRRGDGRTRLDVDTGSGDVTISPR
jgi:hypothetical protein